MSRSDPPTRRPSLAIALVPVVILVGLLWLAVVHFSALELTPHVPLILATLVAAVVALRLGHPWLSVQEGMEQGIHKALGACMILLVIGLLVASWIQAGIVPAMIYYGLELLSPSIFLVATCVICALVSLSTGSSWSTAATVGIALIGVGQGLGIPRPRTAGAIISGGYFGDKMSPLSDTTNLAPAMAGANLFDHIRHMALTTGPSLLLSLVAFGLLGSGAEAAAMDTEKLAGIQAALNREFVVSPWLLLPPLGVIAMVILRTPALPALVAGFLLGAVLAMIVQDVPLGAALKVAYEGYSASTGDAMVDKLLSRGGLSSMFSTVVLIFCALSFGGVMEKAGMLERFATAVLSLAHGMGGLITATIGTCIGMNVLASDQYLAIVVPGRMYRDAYASMGLHPKNLSRALEDSGTLTSVLIPWNTCGAFMIATLGLSPWTYVPYCFLNLLNPLVSIFYGFTGLTMAPSDPVSDPAEEH